MQRTASNNGGKAVVSAALLSAVVYSAPAAAQQTSSDASTMEMQESAANTDAPSDDFDLSARGATNVQLFRRALLPGPGGAIVTDKTLLPLHQSLSVRAARVDTPVGKDSLEMQVATWGQLVFGSPEDREAGSWDVSSAWVRQRFGPLALTVGRQTMAGGAARYARFDGAHVRADLTHDLSLTAYGGWTALPRYNEWYGYHYLGDGYENWTGDSQIVGRRGKNWMSGFAAQWKNDRVGSLGLSYHYQAENNSLTNEILGLNGAFTYFKQVEARVDALLSTEQGRFSDVRANVRWDVYQKKEVAVSARAEYLRTVPALLLSQASVFSVFSFEEVNEAGGQLELKLPYRFTVDGSGYAQMYQEGDPGMRLGLGASFRSDDDGTFYARVMSRRVSTLNNGYWMVRAAARYGFLPEWYATLDMYQYVYDEDIRGFASSSFYAAHLGYKPKRRYDARIGGSINTSPYAQLDAQLLARLTIEWDRGEAW